MAQNTALYAPASGEANKGEFAPHRNHLWSSSDDISSGPSGRCSEFRTNQPLPKRRMQKRRMLRSTKGSEADLGSWRCPWAGGGAC